MKQVRKVQVRLQSNIFCSQGKVIYWIASIIQNNRQEDRFFRNFIQIFNILTDRCDMKSTGSSKILTSGIWNLREVLRRHKGTQIFSPSFNARTHRLTVMFGQKSEICTGVEIFGVWVFEKLQFDFVNLWAID